MTTLYPRLSDPDARVALTGMRQLSVEDLRARSGLDHPAMYYAPTGGVPASADHLRQIVTAVRDSAARHGYPGSGRHAVSRDVIAFDRDLTRVVFETSAMTPAEAATPEIWTFMAVKMLPDVTKWRWPSAGNEERWLGATLVRHTFARLWWQAYALSTETTAGHDYGLLDELSESDLNQIFERRSIGGCPPLARALVIELLEARRASTDTTERELVRDVTKRIGRLLPYTSFLALDEDDLRRRMREVVAESITALAEAQ